MLGRLGLKGFEFRVDPSPINMASTETYIATVISQKPSQATLARKDLGIS